MDDLIKRQDAIRAVTTRDGCGRCEKAIKNIPFVDAVEVVRCKDCKHAEYDHEAKYDGQKWYLCRHAWGQFNSETHFCSNGERKTDG